jgi:hypothetical protein
MEIRNSRRPKKEKRLMSKVKSIFIIFLDIKEIVRKEFALADQITHTTVTFMAILGCVGKK